MLISPERKRGLNANLGPEHPGGWSQIFQTHHTHGLQHTMYHGWPAICCIFALEVSELSALKKA